MTRTELKLNQVPCFVEAIVLRSAWLRYFLGRLVPTNALLANSYYVLLLNNIT